MVNMLLARTLRRRGIHQRSPATSPSSLRSVKVALSFSTRAASSQVVVTQTLPMMGNLVATTGPAARKFVTPAAGSRKNSWRVKSTRAAIVHASPLSLPAKAGHPVCNARAMRQMRAISRILWLNWISLRLKLHSKRHSDIGYRHPITDEQTGAPAFGYPAKDQRELAAECRRLKRRQAS